MSNIKNPDTSKLSISDIDNTSSYQETSAPISSNWAYDHENAADPHAVYFKKAYVPGRYWTNQTVSTNYDLVATAYGDGRYITVGDNNGDELVLTSTDSAHWTATTPESITSTPTSVCYGEGKFVIVSSSGIYTSTDSTASSWSQTGTLTNASSVCYGDGLFVAVASDSSAYRYSTDGGTTWSSGTMSQSGYNSVCFGNGLYVAVGDDKVATSSSGESWTQRVAPLSNNWKSVVYGNGKFVVVSDDGVGTSRVGWSYDGITWYSGLAAEDASWNSVCYGLGIFLAVSDDATARVMWSIDANNWNSVTTYSDNEWVSVCYGNSVFLSVGNNGNNRIMTSGANESHFHHASNHTHDELYYTKSGADSQFVESGTGDSGSFTTNDGKTVTVVDGRITVIEESPS